MGRGTIDIMLRSFSSSGFGLWLLLTGFVSSHWSASRAWGEGDAEPVARKLLATTLTVRSAPPAPADGPALAGKAKSSAGNARQVRSEFGADTAAKDAVKEAELSEEDVAETRLNRHD